MSSIKKSEAYPGSSNITKAQAYPIFLSFLCMGFGDVVGPLTSQLQADYQLSNMSAGLVTFMGFIMFGLLSIPMSIYQSHKGKKHVLKLGLMIALVGLMVPMVSNFESFPLILLGLLCLGTGATLLQVSGNPIMQSVSPQGKYASYLSYGQFIKAIGSLSGALIPLVATMFWGLDWKLLFPIYSVIILITIVYLHFTKINEATDKSSEKPASFASCMSALATPKIALMVLGIFFYVGAEVTMSSRLPTFLKHAFQFDIKEFGLWGTLFFFLSLMVGRFIGGMVLSRVSPSRFLVVSSVISLIGILGLFFAPNTLVGFIVIGLIGLGFSNIFPLIFSMTIESFPEKSNEISGLMVTAIIGGAIMPVLFGFIADSFGFMSGFFVCFASFLYILFLSFTAKKG